MLPFIYTGNHYFPPEGDGIVLSPVLTPFKIIFGCPSRAAPFALLIDFVRTGAITQLIPVAYLLFFYVFFSPSHLLSSPFYSLSLLVVTQIRGQIAGYSPPLPTKVRALHFFFTKIFRLFLPSSTRVELCLPTLGALSS